MKWLIMLALVPVLVRCDSEEIKGAHSVTIQLVGGCDRSGYCGVHYSDGSFGEHHKPVVGMLVHFAPRYKYSLDWRWSESK